MVMGKGLVVAGMDRPEKLVFPLMNISFSSCIENVNPSSEFQQKIAIKTMISLFRKEENQEILITLGTLYQKIIIKNNLGVPVCLCALMHFSKSAQAKILDNIFFSQIFCNMKEKLNLQLSLLSNPTSNSLFSSFISTFQPKFDFLSNLLFFHSFFKGLSFINKPKPVVHSSKTLNLDVKSHPKKIIINSNKNILDLRKKAFDSWEKRKMKQLEEEKKQILEKEKTLEEKNKLKYSNGGFLSFKNYMNKKKLRKSKNY